MKPRVVVRPIVVSVIVTAFLTVALAAAPPVGATRGLARPTWSTTLVNGPWGLAADALGVVVTSDADTVRALDRSGRVQWDVPVAVASMGSPAIDATTVLVGGVGRVSARSRATGAIRWEQPMRGDVTTLALAGGMALAGDQTGDLRAFDAGSGAARWLAHYDGALVSALRVDADAGVVVATWHWSLSPALRVLELATGSLRWQTPVGRFTAAPVVRSGLVVLAEGDGEYHAQARALDVRSGVARWATAMPRSFESGIEPAADERSVAVVDHFGNVTLLDLSTGTRRWHRDLDRGVLETRVALVADRVVISAFSGEVFVLARADGRLVARATAPRLHGLVVATAVAPWGDRPGLLVALRLAEPARVELRPIP